MKSSKVRDDTAGGAKFTPVVDLGSQLLFRPSCVDSGGLTAPKPVLSLPVGQELYGPRRAPGAPDRSIPPTRPIIPAGVSYARSERICSISWRPMAWCSPRNILRSARRDATSGADSAGIR